MTRFVKLTTRNRAPFFAGRAREIQAFFDAVSVADDQPQAYLRIYQGAPGVGKTSLMQHVRENHGENILFVSLKSEDLFGEEALSARIQRAVNEHRKTGSKLLLSLGEAAASLLRVHPVKEIVYEEVERARQRHMVVVLHLDEAHALAEQAERTLMNLHTVGLGGPVPCVLVCTGLAHTENRIARIFGFSRLADDAVLDMEPMSEDECVASTRHLLKTFNVCATMPEEDRICREIARLSCGWPQHLSLAQKALCRGLLAVDGSVERVDIARMQQEADDARYSYYEARVAQLPVGEYRNIIVGILGELAEQESCSLAALGHLCKKHIDRDAQVNAAVRLYATPEEYVKALLAKGILCRDRNDFVDFAIPSMRTWAQVRAREFARTEHGHTDHLIGEHTGGFGYDQSTHHRSQPRYRQGADRAVRARRR